MTWYAVTFLPLLPGDNSCWGNNLSTWYGEAQSPEHADALARAASGNGPERRSFVVEGRVLP